MWQDLPNETKAPQNLMPTTLSETYTWNASLQHCTARRKSAIKLGHL